MPVIAAPTHLDGTGGDTRPAFADLRDRPEMSEAVTPGPSAEHVLGRSMRSGTVRIGETRPLGAQSAAQVAMLSMCPSQA